MNGTHLGRIDKGIVVVNAEHNISGGLPLRGLQPVGIGCTVARTLALTPVLAEIGKAVQCLPLTNLAVRRWTQSMTKDRLSASYRLVLMTAAVKDRRSTFWLESCDGSN